MYYLLLGVNLSNIILMSFENSLTKKNFNTLTCQNRRGLEIDGRQKINNNLIGEGWNSQGGDSKINYTYS